MILRIPRHSAEDDNKERPRAAGDIQRTCRRAEARRRHAHDRPRAPRAYRAA